MVTPAPQSLVQRIIRIGGYTLGSCLALVGTLGLYFEFVDRKTSHNSVFGYALGGAMAVSGVLILVGLGTRYHGGMWSLCGTVLVSFGIVVGSWSADNYLRSSSISVPIECLLVLAFVGLGCSCLVFGHRRHRRLSLVR